MLRGKKRKKEQVCKFEELDKDLNTLKINCKGKITVGNRGINVEKIKQV